jgi:hypothetical protein
LESPRLPRRVVLDRQLIERGQRAIVADDVGRGSGIDVHALPGERGALGAGRDARLPRDRRRTEIAARDRIRCLRIREPRVLTEERGLRIAGVFGDRCGAALRLRLRVRPGSGRARGARES